MTGRLPVLRWSILARDDPGEYSGRSQRTGQSKIGTGSRCGAGGRARLACAVSQRRPPARTWRCRRKFPRQALPLPQPNICPRIVVAASTRTPVPSRRTEMSRVPAKLTGRRELRPQSCIRPRLAVDGLGKLSMGWSGMGTAMNGAITLLAAARNCSALIPSRAKAAWRAIRSRTSGTPIRT
jgi:hypothetical protein